MTEIKEFLNKTIVGRITVGIALAGVALGVIVYKYVIKR